MTRRIALLFIALSVFGLAAALAGAADKPAPAANPRLVMETSLGTIHIELLQKEAPVTVQNFLEYVAAKHYDGTVFHRVIPGFMIQGGGFTADLAQKSTRPPIKNEATNGLKNDRGTLAMARTGNPDSATSQFFINTVNNAGLNRPSPDGFGYAVFGKVVAGMDVVDAVSKVKTGMQKGFRDVPVTPVVIKSIRLEK